MSNDSNFECENNINEAARAYYDNLRPSVSRERYEKVFREFEAWCNRKKVKQITEEVVLVYIGEKSKTCKPSTLWSHHSMLKATLKLNRDINISKYNKVNSFMKRTSTGYKPKKSRVFTKEDVSRFLT
jgi:NAD-dependent DNA ligase